MTFSLVVTPADGCAWITGASSGIGRATALKLAGQGWTVGASARSEDDLLELAREAEGLKGRIIAAPADITDTDAVVGALKTIEEEAGSPVVLALLNAGIYLPVDGLDPDLERFHKSFDVNLGGTANCLVPLVKLMTARRKGHISLVSSVTGYGGLPTSAAYGATKAALQNLAESFYFDLARRGVRISVVNPGFVETPATDDNPFPMPFIVPAETAAERIVEGLGKPGFEITFPKRFTYALKLLNLLPRRLYLPLVARATGWSKKD